MNLAEILFRPRQRAAVKQELGHPASGIIGWAGGGGSLAGVSVDENSALNYSAVWAATRLLCATGSWLPLNLYRTRADGGKDLDTANPLYRVLHDAPNPEMSSMSFRLQAIAQQVNRGNCYAEIQRDGAGRVEALWPIHATRVTPERKDGAGSLRYLVWSEGGRRQVPLPAEDVFHVPSLISDDGVCGKGVIQHARESIGFGLATERHGAAYFGNGARPNVVVTHPRMLSQEARQNFRREWKEIHGGPDKAGELALLQEGADVKILNVSPEDSQFLETRQFNVNEIARWYGVPPHMIADLTRSTNNNIEHQGLEFVIYSLIPWLKMWEHEIWRKLLTVAEKKTHYAKHVVDALLRGDAASRASALQTQFQNGALTEDEWREIEDRNPLPDGLGKRFFVAANLTPVDKAGVPEEEPRPPTAGPVSEEDEPDTEIEEEDEENEEARAKELRLRSALRGVLADAVARCVRKEAKAATWAATKPELFGKWLNDFYGDHGDHMRAALFPAWQAAVVAGTTALAETMVSEHVQESQSLLLAACECQPAELRPNIEACVASWGERAERFAELVLGGPSI